MEGRKMKIKVYTFMMFLMMHSLVLGMHADALVASRAELEERYERYAHSANSDVRYWLFGCFINPTWPQEKRVVKSALLHTHCQLMFKAYKKSQLQYGDQYFQTYGQYPL